MKIDINTIFNIENKLSFLVGSGISIDPPSCLPTGYQYTRFLLKRFLPEEEISKILKIISKQGEDIDNQGNFLRFEELVELIKSEIDPELRILDCFKECKKPNINHLLLSSMLVSGHDIFTTNFDSLIEYALIENKIKRMDIFPVIYKNDWSSYKKENVYYVYKIHGSLSNICSGVECRDSVQASLSQIAKGKNQYFQLEYWKHEIFETSLQLNDLIVIGYSGLDDFDVMPSLWNIHSLKRLFWIRHDHKRTIDNAKVEIIGNSDSGKLRSERLLKNLIKFYKMKARKPDRVFLVTVNATELLKWLSQKYAPGNYKIIFTTSLNSDNFVASNYFLPIDLEIPENKKWLIAAQIYEDRNLKTEGLRAFNKAYELSISSGDKNYQSVCLYRIGNFHEPDESLKFYYKALELSEQLEHTEITSKILANIGWTLFNNKNKTQEAIELFHKSLELSKNEKETATTLGNIGLVLYNQFRFEEALTYFHKALNIDEKYGDLRGKANRLNNIGGALYQLGRYEECEKNLEQSIYILGQIGDLLEKARYLRNMGFLLSRMKLYLKAINHLNKALELAIYLEDKDLSNLIKSDLLTINMKTGIDIDDYSIFNE